MKPRRFPHAVTVGTVIVFTAILMIAADGSAPANSAVLAEAKDLNTVINNIVSWLKGLLFALATLCLTIGGLRYLLAGGDPGEVSKAKDTLKYAAIGYAIVALAETALMPVLKGFVGA